jgi:hypothetical protein
MFIPCPFFYFQNEGVVKDGCRKKRMFPQDQLPMEEQQGGIEIEIVYRASR